MRFFETETLEELVDLLRDQIEFKCETCEYGPLRCLDCASLIHLHIKDLCERENLKKEMS